MKAKIILQNYYIFACKLRVHWDETVPQDLHTSWSEFLAEADTINSIRMLNHVIAIDSVTIELHGFCDASEKAYGAAIYIRSHSAKITKSHFLCVKSRVAPIKTLSLPRLELCGALLLAKLTCKVKLTININKTYH